MNKRKWEHPEKVGVEPVKIPSGHYLSLTDYAKREGITRMTAHLRIKRGSVSGAVKIGRILLIRL